VLQPPAFVFTFDFDLLFQLPNSTKVWTGLGPYKVLRREKRDLYIGMEELLERCEIHFFLLQFENLVFQTRFRWKGVRPEGSL
jgi:hypothetical protein